MHFIVDPFGISFPAPLGIILLSRILALTASRPQRSPLALILPHDILDRSHIVLRFPHIIQPRPPHPLLPPLHNLNPLHIRTINLIPHLDPHPSQLPPKQNPGIDPAPPDIQADAGEGIAVPQPDEQDIAHARRLGVLLREEPRAGSRRVEEGELRRRDGGDGVAAGFARRRRRLEGRDFLDGLAGLGQGCGCGCPGLYGLGDGGEEPLLLLVGA